MPDAKRNRGDFSRIDTGAGALMTLRRRHSRFGPCHRRQSLGFDGSDNFHAAFSSQRFNDGPVVPPSYMTTTKFKFRNTAKFLPACIVKADRYDGSIAPYS